MELSLSNVLLSCILLILIWAAFMPKFLQWRSHFSRFKRLVNYIPGPVPLPLLGNVLPLTMGPQNKFLKTMGEFNNQYRPCFRLWIGPLMGTVHISSWKYAEEIFNSNVHIEKSSTYQFLNSWLGTGLLTSTGAKWHSRRKLLTPAFHRSVLDNFQEVFVEKSHILVKKLLPKCQEGKVFDIAPFIWQSSLDIICETAMGTKMEIQEKLSKEDAAYLQAISGAAEITLHRFMRPWIHSDFIFNLTPTGRKFNQYVKTMHEFTDKVISSKKAEYLKSKIQATSEQKDEDDGLNLKKRKAFIDILIDASFGDSHENKPLLSDLDIREEVDTFMFEGHDTTASGISWSLYLLGRHAEIQESLRLYPSVPMIARKIRQDVKLGDYTVPAESEVVIHMFFAHRDPEVFPEPNKYNPDNFLPENCNKRPAYAFVPFSAGSRNCIGQKFAMQEAKTVVATVLQNYRVEAVDAPEDLILLSELILRSEKGINLRLYPRK
ncbi:hypothetical protein J437_LFUL017819 [Ladona fulva]|uniref:Cytochrome P450 n=1 Tax=Ladona fulva TaxID=123851 RepID=A0A8K0PBX7_LADFU|nr:hypothetical protein J437_LFUL017819 [Ladona fulva]